ncbi:MAG: hypothetical protein KF681_15975 [Bdellovibrionaceae bacterium]|nr:hypothetical protein [Pseudobdellovibrionaceae bacterium]
MPKKNDNLFTDILVGGAKVKAAMDLDSAARDLAALRQIEQQRMASEERERDRREQAESVERQRRHAVAVEEERQSKLARIEMIRQKNLGIHLDQLRTVENIALQRSLTVEEAAQSFRDTLIKNECGFLLPDQTCPPDQMKLALMEKYGLSIEDFAGVASEVVVGLPFSRAVDDWRKLTAEADLKAIKFGQDEIEKATKLLERAESIQKKSAQVGAFSVTSMRKALGLLRVFPSPRVLMGAIVLMTLAAWVPTRLNFFVAFGCAFLGVGGIVLALTMLVRRSLSSTLFDLGNFPSLGTLKEPHGRLTTVFGLLERIALHLPKGPLRDAEFEAAFWLAARKDMEVMTVLFSEANSATLKSLCQRIDAFKVLDGAHASVVEVLVASSRAEKVAEIIVASASRFQALTPDVIFRTGWCGLAARKRLGQSFSDVAAVATSTLDELRDQGESLKALQAVKETNAEVARVMSALGQQANNSSMSAMERNALKSVQNHIGTDAGSINEKLVSQLTTTAAYLNSVSRAETRAA